MKKLIFTLIFTVSYLQSDYLYHPEAKTLINELVNEHGFDESFVKDVLLNAEKKQKIIDSISKPAEFTWTWDRYKKLFIEEKRIKNGKLFINENLTTLQKAEKEFGVPKEVITAIIGVETRYGKIQGNYRVIDSLLTLGFDYPRRSKFFRKELVNFFLLTRENELDILNIKGSYAGAMGYGQFISSSYRAYAIDYDGDGNADLFNSVDDAIGSVANYLYIHGWKREGEIVYETFPNNVRKVFKPSDGLSKFIPLSFNEDGKDINFIGDDNFIAITKYNISHFYAMAVYHLSEELKI
ncbi:lytic murein transglycosylase B [Gammaproteobacteria bacterium]|jgi:membrane-bound lytic murein transglycosylase B|nr:lytic murein transglycosylase B [Gammaproteobacteria bacterium]MDA9173985.1 lytic murein transglycosylase B [Gammaproteobacteria bacterium]MDB4848997.1 lytic murein transglycosylase B [Gammaproteobacteria bacterium]MDC0401745.1 lytic murein transglycosylase B [Gammaproteobacteria bacterium]